MSERFDIEYIAHLARLKLRDSTDKQYLSSDIEEILRYIRKLNELDTENIEPLASVFPLRNVWRDDESGESLTADEALANAPEKGDGMFKVPKVIE